MSIVKKLKEKELVAPGSSISIAAVAHIREHIDNLTPEERQHIVKMIDNIRNGGLEALQAKINRMLHPLTKRDAAERQQTKLSELAQVVLMMTQLSVIFKKQGVVDIRIEGDDAKKLANGIEELKNKLKQAIEKGETSPELDEATDKILSISKGNIIDGDFEEVEQEDEQIP